jgi:hypothetical protein
VSAWRRRAIESFPELHSALSDPEEVFSVYALWFELLPMVKEAHRADDGDLLDRIYDYAEWSIQQQELCNAVAVAFYERLLDEAWMRPLVATRLSARVVSEVRPLWAERLAPSELAAVERLMEAPVRGCDARLLACRPT